jgi:hypothetical protein
MIFPASGRKASTSGTGSWVKTKTVFPKLSNASARAREAPMASPSGFWWVEIKKV